MFISSRFREFLKICTVPENVRSDCAGVIGKASDDQQQRNVFEVVLPLFQGLGEDDDSSFLLFGSSAAAPGAFRYAFTFAVARNQ